MFAHQSPPVSPGRGRHRRQQHEQVDRHPFAHQRGGEPAHRLRHEDEVAAVADGVDDDVGVLGEAGPVVVAGQVEGDDVVAARSVSRGTTRCQYQGSDPAPGMRTYVAMRIRRSRARGLIGASDGV